MGMLGSSFANVPGMDSPYVTYENAFSWGGYPRLGLILPATIDSAAVDARISPTWRLAPGLVLGQIASGGNYTNYSPTATDGSQIACAVLMQGLRMQDVFTGSTTNKALGVLVSGPVRAVNLGGLDQKARYDMKLQGFVFDDDPHGPVGWKVVEGAFGNVTTVVPAPAVGATYQNGTHFVVTSGTGTATFTLPTIAPGLKYKFSQIMDQSMLVQHAGSDGVIAYNNAAAASVAFSTSSQKIGGSVEVEAVYVGSATYKWLVHNVSAGANTVTVA